MTALECARTCHCFVCRVARGDQESEPAWVRAFARKVLTIARRQEREAKYQRKQAERRAAEQNTLLARAARWVFL
jgi:hypothetical protein